MPIAITRQVSPRFSECELTYIERTPIDLPLAHAQHEQYVQALTSLGCRVIELTANPDLPDSVFVEDTAVVLPEMALITNPGAASRKPETRSISEVIRPFRSLEFIRSPATLDGGDVLVMGKKIFVGLSTRSNQTSLDQLSDIVGQFGYQIQSLAFAGCLHLKSAVTRVEEGVLLLNPDWIDPGNFANYEMILVNPLEPAAANCLPVGGSVIFPAEFRKTYAILEAQGYDLLPIPMSEFAKAEGAVTCCSLIID